MDSNPLHVIVLAAGEGRRMRSALPKVLVPLAGRPMLDHVLDAARALEPTGISVVWGHRGEALRAACANAQDLDWVHQAEQRGTGHAVALALPGIADDTRVLVLYGDVPLLTANTLRPLAEAPAELAVLTAYLADPHGYGRVLTNADGRVDRIVEERDANAEERRVHVVNTGVVAAQAGALRAWLARVRPDNAQGELYLTDVFALAAAEGRAALAVPCADPHEAFGANDAWQLAELERYYQRRLLRELCRAGLRVADPARVDVRGQLAHGQDVEIDVDVIVEGRVELGDGVHIGPYTRVRNARLAPGTEVLAHCDLDGVVTHGPCRIGPYARLRPGTELEADAHVGNFVETKQARIGRGSKANHLSYVGDAVVGAGVNLGAGTITCNYDGVNKHVTHIEDGAFIGSNSSLVAPVTIGAGATIGAGSTIARDAPAGELTVARAKQGTIKGWKRPTRKA
ncbi:MAG: bifunctional UDP-N-acetylglucosamine diphosphorylase/glucosamine-1-phosphate N-acetyltransferase GlmU [Xanthomonadales bacterium]|nr:Bifunctional protein GlmU [Xanthomonadales bacterium]MCC6594426.1 bifunctional UDP-N-acetylglucosamine diphosphorylase/glucosamine-1-phosphate N-acetyltransferase GlmU [Xanthomonadales bacterium]MCE7931107.1 UDP-N-acetylglucosamine diphosphorylase/glucosamine-1-phosphate N-acetyltransferase [Xanthomonadales bacterium PRO6]